jgi:5-oxoprolinase (ATP-hydrolysing)
MQEAVKKQIEFHPEWKDGEVMCSNHPQAGGSHLPDITVITPVFSQGKIVFFVASRGHHADIGGVTPGSMPPFSKRLDEEGVAILSMKLVENGEFQEKIVREVFAKSRCLEDNLSDLKAQTSANKKGISLISELIEEYSLDVVLAYMKFIQEAARVSVEDLLMKTFNEKGEMKAKDFLDDGTKIKLKILINKKSAVFDFSGTGQQVMSNLKSPPAVVKSAILYCLRCLVGSDIPLNQGCMDPITVILPENSILSPSGEAAVVGGNVLTSQRITDVIFKAFQSCAASQGCMNNLTFGNEDFGFYETIAGGAGAGNGWNGESAVHTHMTNTRITDVEIMERRYPVIVNRFQIRRNSGGKGKFRGGDGVVREIQFLARMQVGILSERRAFRPYGMAGGKPGKRGKNFLVKDGIEVNIGGKNLCDVQNGDRIIIYTPGGGGYGAEDNQETS